MINNLNYGQQEAQNILPVASRMIISFLCCCLFSCDPGFDESLVIKNQSQQTLSFTIKQSLLNSYHDTSMLRTNNHHLSVIHTINNDTLSSVILVPFQSFIDIYHDGGVGNITFSDDASAKKKMSEAFDTIILSSHVLVKNLYDISLWERNVAKNRYSSSAHFTFIIEEKDLK